MPDLDVVISQILKRQQSVPVGESLLVVVSGIDGSGKGFITGRLVESLRRVGCNAVGINVDGWLNLPTKRFSQDRPAEHFYTHAFRFDEMFDRLIVPLKRSRSITLVAELVEETAKAYHSHRYDFRDVDVIVLEGAYLLKPEYRHHYDLSIWVECSFETALERAIQRSQEGLPPAETIQAYETIYFPAERIHFELDDPKSASDLVVVNDERLMRDEPGSIERGQPDTFRKVNGNSAAS